MKKILALMLTVMMLLTSVSLTAVAADVYTPVSIYAGARTITVEYSQAITADNVGTIVLTTKEGTAVNYTTKINDEFLTIIAEDEFVRDTQSYNLQIGDVKKEFTVKTLFKPEFVADTANNTVTGLSFAAGNCGTVDVVDKNTLILSSDQGSFTLDYDAITNYENASIVADVAYIDGGGTGIKGAFAYNVSSKTPTYAYAYNGAKKVNRAFLYLDKGVTPNAYYNRRVAVTDGTNLLSFAGYNTAITPLVDMSATAIKRGSYKNSYGTAMVSGQVTVGTNGLPDDYTGYTYHYVIDKMGAVGTLMFDDSFVDIMDSQDYYDEYNSANGTALNASTKGYFSINPISNTAGRYRILVTNMALITSEMVDVGDAGDISLTASVSNTEGNQVTITLTGAENIDISAVAVEDYISFSDSLEYNVVSKTGNTIVIEAISPVYDKQYTLTVSEGLGYDNLKVKETQTFDVTFIKEQEEEIFTPVSIYAGARTITVEYAANITEENVGDIVLTTDDGTAVSFTTKYNDEFLTIIAEDEFVRDTENYIIQLGDYKKIFKIKTLFTPNFVADTENNTVSGLAIAAGQGATVDVIDANTILLSTIQGSFTLDYEDITKYENASIVADVHFVGGNANRVRGTFAYNVSSKTPTYAYAYNGAIKVNRAFWYLNKEESAIHNRRVAVTDGTSLLHFAGYTDPILPKTVYTDTIKRGIYANAPGTAFVENQVAVGNSYNPGSALTVENKYRYVIDKMGAVGTLMMNDTFIDIMDSQDYYDDYNTENGTALNAATKGYFSINPVSDGATSGNSRIMLSNIALITSEMKDYEGVEITDVTYLNANNETLESIKNASAVKGEVTVENRFATEKPVKLVAIAYSGNKMIGIDILDIDTLSANQPSKREYSLTGLSELTEIKVVAWENFAKMYPYCAPAINNK